MTKSQGDIVLDQALNYLKNKSERITACSQAPTTYTEAISTYKLAYTTISAADFTGPANGDTSGRKITVGQKSNVPVSTTGSANHIALVHVSGTSLLYVTEVSATQQLTAGNTMTFEAWDIEIQDPT